MTPELQAHARFLCEHIVKNPVLQHGGILNVKGSLRILPDDVKPYLRYASSKYVLDFLRAFPEEFPTLKPIPLNSHKGGGGIRTRGNGLRVGPNVQAMDWEDFKQPWVYELVCEPTGRRYIGVANRPDLRRAVHYYWLGNIDKPGASNIFRKNVKLKEDVLKYGRDAFYMDVLERANHAKNKGYITATEWKWLEHYGQDAVYNDMQRRKNGEKRQCVDREINKLWKVTSKTWEEVRTLVAQRTKLSRALSAKRTKLSKGKTGRYRYTDEINAKLARDITLEKQLRHKISRLRQRLRDLTQERRELMKQRPPTVPRFVGSRTDPNAPKRPVGRPSSRRVSPPGPDSPPQ